MRIQNFSPNNLLPTSLPAPARYLIIGASALAIGALAIWVLQKLTVSLAEAFVKRFNFSPQTATPNPKKGGAKPTKVDVQHDPRIENVPGDGNCYFHALSRILQKIDHPQKDCTVDQMRTVMSIYLQDVLLDRPDLTKALRDELSEIAEGQSRAAANQEHRELVMRRFLPIWASYGTSLEKLRQQKDYFSDVSAALAVPDDLDADIQAVMDMMAGEMASKLGENGVFIGEVGARVMAELLGVQITIHGPSAGYPVLFTCGNPDDREIHLLNSGNHFQAMFYPETPE